MRAFDGKLYKDHAFSFVSKDIRAPQKPTNIKLLPTESEVAISWENSDDEDLKEVMIIRKVDSASESRRDGVQVYKGVGETVTDTDITPNTQYFYTFFTKDTSGNSSKPFSVTTIIRDLTVPLDIEESKDFGEVEVSLAGTTEVKPNQTIKAAQITIPTGGEFKLAANAGYRS